MAADPAFVLTREEKSLAERDAAGAVAALRARLHLDVSVAMRLVAGWRAKAWGYGRGRKVDADAGDVRAASDGAGPASSGDPVEARIAEITQLAELRDYAYDAKGDANNTIIWLLHHLKACRAALRNLIAAADVDPRDGAMLKAAEAALAGQQPPISVLPTPHPEDHCALKSSVTRDGRVVERRYACGYIWRVGGPA